MVEIPSNRSDEKQQNRRNLQLELDRIDKVLDELKVQYEQYFSGVLTLPPDKLHSETERSIKLMMRAPFRNSAVNFRLRMVRYRYNTLATYWQRVIREREEGIYYKDVFKANLHERLALEDAKAETALGLAEKNLMTLFNSYQQALEKYGAKKTKVDFESFQKSLIKRAKDLRAQHTGKKLSFKVVVKNGKVTLQASVKS